MKGGGLTNFLYSNRRTKEIGDTQSASAVSKVNRRMEIAIIGFAKCLGLDGASCETEETGNER